MFDINILKRFKNIKKKNNLISFYNYKLNRSHLRRAFVIHNHCLGYFLKYTLFIHSLSAVLLLLKSHVMNGNS